MTLAEEIKKFFKGEIQEDSATLDTYSRDASLFEVEPSLVVCPQDLGDLKNLVRFAAEKKARGENISLTARSGGTDMTGGPLTESIVVDMQKHFNRILELGDGYVVVQPGMFYRDFEKETLKKGWLLPSYPASREICTVGGMVSNNSGGEKTLSYGKTEQYVEELKMVLRDGNEYVFKALTLAELEQKKQQQDLEGEIYRKISDLIIQNESEIKAAKPQVSKNSSGYYLWNVWDKEKGIFDLPKMLVGSQGTFGIVTEIKFRLIKPKTHSKLLLIFLKDLKILGEVANHVLQFKPESFESYDDHTFKVAIKIFPELVKFFKGNLLTLAIKFLPEFWMILSGGVPKLIMLAEFTADSDQEALEKAKEAQISLKEFNLPTKLIQTQKEAQKYWVIRRESFNMLRHHIKGLRTAPFIDDIIVRPEKLPEFLPQLNQILDQYKHLIYTIAGHVGDGNFHIIPLMDMTKPESEKIIAEISDKVYKLVLEFKGSITAEHNDGLIRSPYIPAMFGQNIYQLFIQTKQIFDPDNIFNPGKKVGAILAYTLNHLDKSPHLG